MVLTGTSPRPLSVQVGRTRGLSAQWLVKTHADERERRKSRKSLTRRMSFTGRQSITGASRLSTPGRLSTTSDYDGAGRLSGVARISGVLAARLSGVRSAVRRDSTSDQVPTPADSFDHGDEASSASAADTGFIAKGMYKDLGTAVLVMYGAHGGHAETDAEDMDTAAGMDEGSTGLRRRSSAWRRRSSRLFIRETARDSSTTGTPVERGAADAVAATGGGEATSDAAAATGGGEESAPGAEAGALLHAWEKPGTPLRLARDNVQPLEAAATTPPNAGAGADAAPHWLDPIFKFSSFGNAADGAASPLALAPEARKSTGRRRGLFPTGSRGHQEPPVAGNDEPGRRAAWEEELSAPADGSAETAADAADAEAAQHAAAGPVCEGFAESSALVNSKPRVGGPTLGAPRAATPPSAKVAPTPPSSARRRGVSSAGSNSGLVTTDLGPEGDAARGVMRDRKSTSRGGGAAVVAPAEEWGAAPGPDAADAPAQPGSAVDGLPVLASVDAEGPAPTKLGWCEGEPLSPIEDRKSVV